MTPSRPAGAAVRGRLRAAAVSAWMISAAGLGFAASDAAGRFRHHPQQVVNEDFAVLLRWLRLALTSDHRRNGDMGREPGLPPPSATAHGIQFCAPTHRVTVIPDFAQIGGSARGY